MNDPNLAFQTGLIAGVLAQRPECKDVKMTRDENGNYTGIIEYTYQSGNKYSVILMPHEGNKP